MDAVRPDDPRGSEQNRNGGSDARQSDLGSGVDAELNAAIAASLDTHRAEYNGSYDDVMARSEEETAADRWAMPFVLELFFSWRLLCLCRIPGDGNNCWFAAIDKLGTTWGLKERFLNKCGCSLESDFQAIRNGMCDWIQRNCANVLDGAEPNQDHWLYSLWFETREVTPLRKYLFQRIRQDKAEVAMHWCSILATMLDAPVTVYGVDALDFRDEIKRWSCRVYEPSQRELFYTSDEMHLWPTIGFIFRFDGTHYDVVIPCNMQFERAPCVFYGNSVLNTVLMYKWIRAVAEHESGMMLYDTSNMPWQAKEIRDKYVPEARVIRPTSGYDYHVSHYDQTGVLSAEGTVYGVIEGFQCRDYSDAQGVGDECVYYGENVWGIQKSVDVCIFEELCALMDVRFGFS